MLLCSIYSLCAGIFSLQYFYIEDNILYIKTDFRVVCKLDLSNCKAFIQTLPSNNSKSNVERKWICIYDNENLDYFSKYKVGPEMRKGKKRVQIIFTEENLKIIEKYIQVEIYPYYVF